MRLLMCAADYFDVSYEINAWMKVTHAPIKSKAKQQWNELYRILTEEVGVEVAMLDPQPGLPDMVFTANAGTVLGNIFVPSRFRHEERQGESLHFVRWFAGNGFQICPLPKDELGAFEGEGDALFYGDLLLGGHGHRSDLSALKAVSQLLKREVVPLQLVDPRWYHLDTCLIPLANDLLAYYPSAFDADSNRILSALPGDKILLTEADALHFGANAVVIDRHVVMNAGCDIFSAELSRRGYTVHATDLSEFLKSGGSAKCLALVLDHA